MSSKNQATPSKKKGTSKGRKKSKIQAKEEAELEEKVKKRLSMFKVASSNTDSIQDTHS